MIHRIPCSLILHLLYCIFYIIVSECEQTFYIFILKHIVHISGHPSSQCTHLNCSSLPPQPPPSIDSVSCDRALVLGDGFLTFSWRVETRPQSCRWFLEELKLGLVIVEFFDQQLWTVEKPSDDINSHLVLMNKKDWLMWGRGRTLAKMCVIALFFYGSGFLNALNLRRCKAA